MSLPVCLSPPAVPLFPSPGCLAALPGVEAQEGVAGMEPQRDEAKPCSKSAQTCEILQFSTAAWEAKDVCSVPWHNKSSPLASHCQAEQHSPFQQCRAVTKHTVLLATPLGSMGSLPTQTCEGRCHHSTPVPLLLLGAHPGQHPTHSRVPSMWRGQCRAHGFWGAMVTWCATVCWGGRPRCGAAQGCCWHRSLA